MAEAELTTVARPYAKAAFGFAVEQDGGLASWSRMLALLAATVSEQIVRERLDDPLATSEQGAAFIVELLDGELDPHARNFVRILAEYDRIDLLPNISELYELLKANHEKTVNVEVISAYDVSEAEAANLSATLQDYLKRPHSAFSICPYVNWANPFINNCLPIMSLN